MTEEVNLTEQEEVELPEEEEKPEQIVYEVDGVELPPVDKGFSVPLKYYPDPILGVATEEVEQIKESELKILASHMIETMYSNVGIGLAGPQIDLPLRVFVWDTEWPNTQQRNPHMIINPKITWKSDELQTLREGCLSVALGWHVNVPRATEVEIEGTNLKGETVTLFGEGITAACFQHEIDHLDGTLILDYDGKMRRKLYDNKVIKYARRRRNAYNKMRKHLKQQEKSLKKIEAAKQRREAKNNEDPVRSQD